MGGQKQEEPVGSLGDILLKRLLIRSGIKNTLNCTIRNKPVAEGQILHDPTYEVFKIVKLIGAESKMVVARSCLVGWNGESLFNEHKISVMQDE